MVNKNYIAGRRVEYKVKKYYEDKGYTVLRTSGSHGFADLIAVRNKESLKRIVFIQCKNRKPTKQEIEKFEEFSWLNIIGIHTRVLTEMVYPDKLKEWSEWSKFKKDKLKKEETEHGIDIDK